MTSIFMVAIEATIVSTAMPQIVTRLGGLDLYGWVVSSFLLTQTALTLLFGKLADVYGRKLTILLGIAILLLGSILAGFAKSMPMMVLFRFIQGIGASAIQPVAMTIVADLYPAHERGKIQGYLSGVWAFSAVLGPIAGALIIRNWSWPWIFWINVPFGVAAAVLFIRFLHEQEHPSRGVQSIDVLGAILFAIAVASLSVALNDVGNSNNRMGLEAACTCFLSSVLFLAQERRAVDPMISFALWKLRPIAAANGVGVLASIALIGLTMFLPIYVQGVLHRSPVVAGLTLTMMLVGWPIAATLAARNLHRFALRQILITGSVFVPAGAAVLVLLTPGSSPIIAALGSLVMGFGMGMISVSSMVLIQGIVDWSQRGSVTASNVFARNLGSTLGATALGAVFNHELAFANGGKPVSSDQLRLLLSVPPGTDTAQTTIGLALQHSLNSIFYAMLIVSLAIVIFARLVPPAASSQSGAVPRR